ncbi:hypothetical protein TRFO_16737 [Tritrichomonas foetus]|uniref:Initiator binding domain-containing protein n=1 Tax=Tritrichomonas foetus TaxID=1144522 RepID=A0A1J4KQJ5_9EUKA|nr:hypothetical protein TRFO_16737 [Tritrichomonas foetus]|eukprot:OHT13184.1 hypothetical protein TRFO_16737 [Tritrichomonas foetus]
MICLGHARFGDDSKETEIMMQTQVHFQQLRLDKTNAPDPSPIQDEILVILKIACEKTNKPIKVLSKIGIIIFEDQIALNTSTLHIFLSSCKSRINNVFRRDGWEIVQMDINQKTEILQPLVDRKETRNWTIRTPPAGSSITKFISQHAELIYDQKDAEFHESPNEIPIHNPNLPQVRALLDLCSGNPEHHAQTRLSTIAGAT